MAICDDPEDSPQDRLLHYAGTQKLHETDFWP